MKILTKWLPVMLLCTLGLAMVIRRILILTGWLHTAALPKFNPDAGFDNHPVITYIHVIAGGLFVILGPFQFMPKIRIRYLAYHRFAGWIFIIAAAVIGGSALALPYFIKPVGGFNEAAATIFFGLTFLCFAFNAVYNIIKRRIAAHREWMIRTFILGLAVATIRPINVLFFIFSKASPQEFFGTAFWLGFSLHLFIAEWYIRHSRSLK